ncbi:MAG: hypothetical protein QY328_00980 [Anaerolineales bacterium]|nr:MAG: hypothetical protein QY328_00980 [Anaerolineales bacterium]
MKNNPVVRDLNNLEKSRTVFPRGEAFDNFKSPINLVNRLQDYVDKTVQRCPDVDWDENSLSFQVIKAIRVVLDGYVLPNTNLSKFGIEAYKLTGKAEQKHGDIAIVVSKSFDNGYPISGVGFYEAKVSSLDGYYYPSFSIQQLRRLVTSTPKLSYLLYERQAQIADTQEWATLSGKLESRFQEQKFFTRVVDANLVKQYKDLAGAAYNMSQSFGYHFVYKILSGRELDYSRPPIDTIRRWLKITRRASALVVSISVRETEKEHFHTQLELPNFDKVRLEFPDQNDIFTSSRKLLE